MTLPIRVRDVMSSPVETAPVDTTAAEAATQCFENDINSLVVRDDGSVVGIVTGTDLLRVLGQERDPQTVCVGDVMSAPVVSTTPETAVEDAMQTMHDKGVARLVALDAGTLVGILSTDDVIRHLPQTFHRHELTPDTDQLHHYHASQETAYEKADWELEASCVAPDCISVGDRIEFSKPISEQDVRTFAAASGDTNRLHLDDEFAAGTRFGRRIVHGTLVSGLISAALARLPGLTIYLSQDLSFRAPVDIGERVTAVCEVVGSIDTNKYELTTDVLDSEGETVVEGQAAVLVDDLPDAGKIDVEQFA